MGLLHFGGYAPYMLNPLSSTIPAYPSSRAAQLDTSNVQPDPLGRMHNASQERAGRNIRTELYPPPAHPTSYSSGAQAMSSMPMRPMLRTGYVTPGRLRRDHRRRPRLPVTTHAGTFPDSRTHTNKRPHMQPSVAYRDSLPSHCPNGMVPTADAAEKARYGRACVSPNIVDLRLTCRRRNSSHRVNPGDELGRR
jgi:hypothetical protein